jgi:DNA-directed RNA polymerase subunit K/omega
VAKRAREISADNAAKEIIVDEKPVLAAIRDFENHKYAILEPDVND